MKSHAILFVSLMIVVFVDFGEAHTDDSNPDHSHETTIKKYKVTTIADPPFVMSSPMGGFEGLIPDILNRIGQIINATFEYEHVADGRYGALLSDGNWTGMIQEVKTKRADIAAAAITITAMRHTDVDFSNPFMDAGIRILVKIPTGWNSLETVFILLAPYRPEVWVIGLLMFVAVAILLYLIGRYSPEERSRIYDEDGLTLNNSFFLSFAAFMLQGYHTIPRSVAARVLICFWWMFTLFFIVGYAANLTAFFLTKEPIKRTMPVMSFNDLARGTNHFGTIKSGSTNQYFNLSKNPMDQAIWGYLKEHPDNLQRSTKDGVARVRKSNGDYAFIMEGPSAEYHASQEPCDLMVVGEPRMTRHYGFACTKDSGVCSDLSVGILQMKESNELELLIKKWYSGTCYKADDEEYFYQGLPFFGKSKSSDIEIEKGVTLKRFGAPITFICVGIGLSIVTLVVEIIFKGRSRKLPGHSNLKEDEQAIQEA